MSRPHGVKSGQSAGNSIDATICAHSGTSVERHYTTADLPRLRDAGAMDGSQFDARFDFSQFEGRVAIDGGLNGSLQLTCQRCMKSFAWPLEEQFKLLLVREAEELEQEFGGYEVVLADPAHLDLQAIAEDQALLALPLVPKHAESDCNVKVVDAEPEKLEPTQTPFGNLRELMRKN